MDKRTTTSGDEILSTISDKCAKVLKKLGINSAHAHRAALAVADHISFEFGGQLVYFKQCKKEDIEEISELYKEENIRYNSINKYIQNIKDITLLFLLEICLNFKFIIFIIIKLL